MPFYDLRLGDALKVLAELPEELVDAVIVDPPYNSGGRTNVERKRSPIQKYVSSDAHPTRQALADFAGDNRDQRGYLTWLSMLLAECLAVAKPGAHALVFTDWRQAPVTSDALQVAGWTWQGTLVWNKPIARPRRGGFKAAAEFIMWGTNGPLVPVPDLYLPGVFSASQPRGRQRRHITAKPVDGLLSELVRICPPGGLILDPCAGSGSTGVAALASDRHFLGVEVTEAYHREAVNRLSALGTPTSLG